MGQEMPGREAGADFRVRHGETLEDARDRRVKVETPALGQHDQGRGGHGLRDGADLKEGVRRDRQRILHARDPEGLRSLDASVAEAERCPGDEQAPQIGPDSGFQLVESFGDR